MSELKVFPAERPDSPLLATDDHATIAAELAGIGVRFERWTPRHEVTPGAPEAEVLVAFNEDIERLGKEGGYVKADVISLAAGNPQAPELRRKFLSEHVHGEDEVRFFVAGQGLFTLHVEDRVYEVLCCTGDLISVPANTRHWFDMGPNPEFVVIRLFNNPEGWVAQFTGDTIADRFHRLEN
jgi:1,2-dihydroxy-3-keto-5-methylthiopentene dioxygenase